MLTRNRRCSVEPSSGRHATHHITPCFAYGWNAGFSEAGGLGRVARCLEGLGAVDITIDQVSAHAKLAGATKHLSNPAKVAWCKSVVALYQRERTLSRAAFASS